MSLQDYLLAIRQAIGGLAGVQVELYREQLLTAIRANLRIRLRLVDQSLLEISEALVIQEGELARLSCRCHWQNVSGQVLFRYDDAPIILRLTRFCITNMSATRSSPRHGRISSMSSRRCNVFSTANDFIALEIGECGQRDGKH